MPLRRGLACSSFNTMGSWRRTRNTWAFKSRGAHAHPLSDFPGSWEAFANPETKSLERTLDRATICRGLRQPPRCCVCPDRAKGGTHGFSLVVENVIPRNLTENQTGAQTCAAGMEMLTKNQMAHLLL